MLPFVCFIARCASLAWWAVTRVRCVYRTIMPHIRILLFKCGQTLDRRRHRLSRPLHAGTRSANPAWMTFMRGPQASMKRRMSTRFDPTRPMPQNACKSQRTRRRGRYSDSAAPPTVTYGSGSLGRFSGDADGCCPRLSAQTVNTLFCCISRIPTLR